MSGSRFTLSVKVVEEERSVDDELPAEDRSANKLLILLSYHVLY